MPWQSIPRFKTSYSLSNRSFQIHGSLRPLYEEQIIKRYLNSTFSPPIVLLTIKSKLVDIHGIKGRQRNECRVMVFFRDLKLQNRREIRALWSSFAHEEQFPAIFPRLFSLLVWAVLSQEAQAHYPQRYFNSCLPSPVHTPWEPSSKASSEERNTGRGCNDCGFTRLNMFIVCVCVAHWFW